MRSRSLAAFALALAACGNYSTDDIAFIEALPPPEALSVALPTPRAQAALGAGQAAVTCGPLGAATEWTEALATGTRMNAGLGWILGAVDLARSREPSERHRDWRAWGPYPDGSHPGVEIRLLVSRSVGADGTPVYSFSFEARRFGFGWTALVDGSFVGASGRTGHGTVTLRFGAIRALGLSGQPDDPAVDVAIAYDRTGDPRTLALSIPLGAAGFGLVDFDYGFQSWASGDSHIDFAIQDLLGDRVVIQAGFLPSGAGRGEVTLYPANPPPVSYQYTVCWDETGCVTAVADFFNVSGRCGAASSCVTPNWDLICPHVK